MAAGELNSRSSVSHSRSSVSHSRSCHFSSDRTSKYKMTSVLKYHALTVGVVLTRTVVRLLEPERVLKIREHRVEMNFWKSYKNCVRRPNRTAIHTSATTVVALKYNSVSDSGHSSCYPTVTIKKYNIDWTLHSRLQFVSRVAVEIDSRHRGATVSFRN
jgi:hypothetical protein